MAPETAEALAAAPAMRIRLRRARRPGQKPPEKGSLRGDPKRAAELGKRGGDAKAALSIRKAFPDVYGLAKKFWTDPQVQSTILDLGRAGLLHPTIQRELLFVFNGRPAYKMQVTLPKDLSEDAKREALRAMPRDERRLLMDLLRKVNRPPLPAPRALPLVKAEAVDAVLVEAKADPEPGAE